MDDSNGSLSPCLLRFLCTIVVGTVREGLAWRHESWRDVKDLLRTTDRHIHVSSKMKVRQMSSLTVNVVPTGFMFAERLRP
jgi:hypothetical protein